MSQVIRKQQAAEAALEFVRDGAVVGVGTGSTVNFFIEALVSLRERIAGTVSSSEGSTQRLQAHGFPVLDLNATGELELYVDGADEATRGFELIKGGGGALTREKVVAAASRKFVCIIDDQKLVDRLGRFPVPVEVIPMARGHVARQLLKLGGQPALREGVVTDNGNHILDIRGLQIADPAGLEAEINQIAGVVAVGLFARRPADVLLVGTADGVVTLARAN
jgi:ribose 5-phosphate isomerase A